MQEQMTEEQKTPDRERLKALRTYARYSNLAFQMIALGALGYFAGRWLDGGFESEKYRYTGLCILVGVGIGLFLFIRSALKRRP